MAEMAQDIDTPAEAQAAQSNKIVFTGPTRNMAMGVVMFAAGAAAFISGLTHTFFATAMAWTFLLWGLLFLYGDLLVSTRRIEVTDEGITIKIPMRLWFRDRTWAWKDVTRVSIVIHKRDTRMDDATIQIHHQYPGEVALDREDTKYDPELVQLIIERAKLKPEAAGYSVDLTQLPFGKDAVFAWKK